MKIVSRNWDESGCSNTSSVWNSWARFSHHFAGKPVVASRNVGCFFRTKSYSNFFFSNMSRMKRIRWLTNVMWSYRGWRKKVKSYLRIWRMKERPMTRSGQYHGNPLHKYHSWGRGGGVLDKVLYLLPPLQGPTPHPFIHHFWQKRGPLSYTFHWQMVLLSCTYFEFMQQEDRAEAKRTAKRWCWTNVKGLLLPCFVVNFT